MTTVLDLIKGAYPSQYAGIIQEGRVLTALDVWSGRQYNGSAFNVLGLPAAADMCPLSAEQWGILGIQSISGMLNLFVKDKALIYPNRFYCDKQKPCSVYDMWGFSSVDGLPAPADLYGISAEEYADRQQNYRAQYYDTAAGKLADYVAPVVVIPLKDQAASENSGWVQAQISEAVAMGETFSDAMKTYVKAIRAIANGSDTTSTALPARPETVFS
ncbi:MAG: hypothetical protein ABF628_02855 [Acetobacter orientalis]|uniref:hypothetical protein n=1 Tax=Acetobacter orientalis TaxID=146474 RepID=UPI0039E80209